MTERKRHSVKAILDRFVSTGPTINLLLNFVGAAFLIIAIGAGGEQ